MTRRGSSPVFVGRRAELDRLDDAFRRAALGQPSLVLVAGEAGVGKSRLIAEFTGRVEATGGWVASGGCLDLGEGGLPYAPFVEALRTLARRLGPDAREAAFGPSTEVLGRLVPDLRWPGGAAQQDGPTDPSSRLARLFDAVIDVLGRLSEERPLTLVLEDVHWADGSTRDLIRFLVRNMRAERLLLIATYRSDDLHRRHPLMPLLSELERADRAERLELRRFDRMELSEQLAEIIGEPPTATLVETLFQRSDGIPFYVEELIAQDGRDEAAMPSTLRDILELRLAALSTGSLALVRSAAVIGGRFSHERLAAVAGMGVDALVGALREATEARILVAADDRHGPSYRFRHALLREAAFDELLPAERVRLHARLADHLERLIEMGATGDPSIVADFAIHAYHAHDQPRALVGAVRALQALVDAAAYREALAHAERALELWPRVADAEERTGVAHADLLALAARAAADAGEPRQAVSLHQAAVLEIERAPDPERLAAQLADLWSVAWETYEFEVSAAAAERALDLLAEFPSSSLKARVLAEVGCDRWTEGRIRESVALYDASMAISREIGDDRTWAIAASLLAHSLGDLGRAGRGETLADEIPADQMAYDGTVWQFWPVADRAMALWYAGRFEDSMQACQVALEAAARYGVEERHAPWLFPFDALFDLGRIDEVEELVHRASVGAAGSHPMLGTWLMSMKCHILRGRLEAARDSISSLPNSPAVNLAWRFEVLVLLARAEGRFDAVRAGVDDTRAIAAGGEADGALWLILGSGIGAAADHAALTRRRRRPAEADEAVSVGSEWLGALRALVEDARADGGAGPFCEATLATAEAECTRLVGSSDRVRWARAVERWSALKHRYQTAYTRLRLAEAILDSNGDRGEAASALHEAHEASSAMDAVPLRDEIEALAARGRIVLGGVKAVAPAELSDTRDAASVLTTRERDVLRLVAGGHTNREIGDRLFISEKTVSVHVSNAMAKLGALSRYEAAASAERLGLL